MLVPLLLWSPAAVAADLHVGAAEPYVDLQAAVDAAAPGDRIVLHAGDYGPARVEALDLEIVAPDGPESTAITSDGIAPALELVGATLTLRAVTLDGAGLQRVIEATDSVLVLEEATVRGGSHPDWGGGLHLDRCDLTMRRSTVEDNTSGGDGGAVYTVETPVVVEGSSFLRNAAGDDGGGLYVSGGDLAVTGSRFEGNTASGSLTDGSGGALHHASGTLTVIGSTFEANAATGDGAGAAIFVSSGAATVLDSTFEANTSDRKGTAIYATSAPLTVEHCRFLGNDGTPTIDQAYGGAVYCGPAADCVIREVVFDGNRAPDGAAICGDVPSSLEVTRSLFCANTADDDAAIDLGAFSSWSSDVPILIRNNVFALQSAVDGGAIHSWDESPVVEHNHFVGNDAATGAAFYQASSASPLFSHNLVWASTGGTAVVLPGAGISDYNLYDANVGGHTAWPGLHDLLDWKPLLVGALPTCDVAQLLPAVGSPLIDAGDPAALPDPDGTVADIGAFGGPEADEKVFLDGDGDGFIAMVDCDDADGAVHPGAAEACDGVDTDCDGLADADDPDASDAQLLFPDGDGDGAGEPWGGRWTCPEAGLVAAGDDCDDDDPARHPAAEDVPGDGIDQDCDGLDAEPPEPGDTGGPGTDPPELPDLDGDGVPDELEGGDGEQAPPEPEYGYGCGCRSGAAPAGWLPLLLLGVLGRRGRRRITSPRPRPAARAPRAARAAPRRAPGPP